MNTNNLLSLLWVFVTVNYIFCDIFSLYNSEFLNALLLGEVDGIRFTERFLLTFAIIMEIPLVMIVLSSLLSDRLNRIFNICAGVLMLIVQVGSLITGSNSLHYIFFSVIEIITLVIIIVVSLKWFEKSTKNISF